MKTYLRRFLSGVLALTAILLIFAIFAFASTPQSPYNDTYINSTQPYNYSASTAGTYKVIGGTNYASSSRTLQISSQYFDGSSNAWKFDKKMKVNINNTLNDTYTTYFSQTMSWRVHLKPYGASSGCNGYGYIWYAM